MSHPFKRSLVSQHEKLVLQDGTQITRWELPAPNESIREIMRIPDPGRFKGIPASENFVIPPYHWHWYQDEYFHISAGRFIFTLEGKEQTLSAADPMPVHIPARARHTFRADDTCEEECVLTITATPPDQSGLSERFFRNVYSYLNDCKKHNKSPSAPQLLLFLDSGEVGLALPGPQFLAHWASYALGVVVGRWWGGYVLGYKTSYEEYYDAKLAKRA
jgi:mannose-6-phosphate isomerase-like protein (cupin superfamily)